MKAKNVSEEVYVVIERSFNMETDSPRRASRQLKITERMKSFNGVHKVSKEEIIKQGSNDSGAENSESELSEVLVSSNKRRRSNDVIENDDKEPEESEEFSEYELLQKKNIEERNQFL
uniref:Uncharacterized protein n=1 Tax=Rhodnius prolixus TaxID=13249 RepID=T1HPC9_RHOPR